MPSDEESNAPRKRASLTCSSSTNCWRASSSFEFRSTLLTNSAIKRVVSTASSSNASGLVPRTDSTPTTAPSRKSGAQISERAPTRLVATRSTRGSVSMSRAYAVSPVRAANPERLAAVGTRMPTCSVAIPEP